MYYGYHGVVLTYRTQKGLWEKEVRTIRRRKGVDNRMRDRRVNLAGDARARETMVLFRTTSTSSGSYYFAWR
jgi:hypothetical protein